MVAVEATVVTVVVVMVIERLATDAAASCLTTPKMHFTD
jgi:hypothetical protein